MTTPAKARQTHEDAPGSTIDPSPPREPREVRCVSCRARVFTCLDQPDGWEGGVCRSCQVWVGLLVAGRQP